MRVNLDYGTAVIHRVHRFLLIGYAALLGLVEGPAEIAAVLVLVTTALTGRLRGYRPGLAEVGILVWGLAGIPGLLLDAGPHSSGNTTRPLLALTFLIGARAIGGADRRLLSRLAWAFGIACVINATVGLLQFVVNGPLPLEEVFLKNAKSAQLYVPNHVYHVRASSGLFYNRLKLAHVGMIGAFLIGLVAMSRDVPRRTRVLAGGGGILLAGGLVFTYARMAFVSVAAACLSIALVLRRYLLLAGVALTSLLVAGGMLMTDAGQKRMISLSFDLGLRQKMAVAALEIFLDHPILGVGHGVYQNAIARMDVDSLTGVHLTSPHNIWLMALAETGLVGFIGFNLAVGACLYAVVRRVSRAKIGPWARLDRLALLSLLAILFVGLMHFSLHHAPVSMAFWTLAGVCVRTKEGDGEEAEEAEN